MRKLIVCMITLCLLLSASCGAMAAGVTLRTFTPFADIDYAAQSYMDMITAWEEETGNVVEDYSGLMDEAWLGNLKDMIASGEADVVVVPLGSGLTASELVPVDELLAAAPDCGARRFSSMAEADGSVLLTPLRLNWEALYVNVDVLAAHGLNVPTTFDQLVSTCAALAQAGVVPIANALCEWSEIVLDCAALAGAPEDQYGQQASLDGAKDVLTALAQVGAFGADAWNATEADYEAMFLSGGAAMRIDSDGLAQEVGAERTDSVVVIALPAKDGQARSHVAGTPGVGLAVTRACWQDAGRREAALSLVSRMLSAEAAPQLAAGAQGLLGKSIAALTFSAADCTGLLYDANPDSFDSWSESVISSLMGM